MTLLANPYFMHGFTFPIDQLLLCSFSRKEGVQQLIIEM